MCVSCSPGPLVEAAGCRRTINLQASCPAEQSGKAAQRPETAQLGDAGMEDGS